MHGDNSVKYKRISLLYSDHDNMTWWEANTVHWLVLSGTVPKIKDIVYTRHVKLIHISQPIFIILNVVHAPSSEEGRKNLMQYWTLNSVPHN
jgi:hypothetical protein